MIRSAGGFGGTTVLGTAAGGLQTGGGGSSLSAGVSPAMVRSSSCKASSNVTGRVFGAVGFFLFLRPITLKIR